MAEKKFTFSMQKSGKEDVAIHRFVNTRFVNTRFVNTIGRNWTLISLISIWLLVIFWVQGSIFDWWFEDDPGLYSVAANAANPWEFFLNKSYFARNEVIPMQFLLMWVDSKIYYASPTVGYLHNAVLYLMSSLLIYRLVLNFSQDQIYAFFIAVLWMFLPSTLATHEYLSTRCYLIGLVMGLIATDLSLKNPPRSILGKALYFGGLMATSMAAVVSKEFYPPIFPTVIALVGLLSRRFSLVAISVIVAIFYAFFRNWAVGLHGQYGMPILPFDQSLKVYSKVIFMFLGSNWSYVAWIALMMIISWAVYQKRLKPREVLLWSILMFIAFATIYPVLTALDSNWDSYGTWFRTPFVINTIALIGMSYIIWKTQSPLIKGTFFLIVLLGLSEGVPKVLAEWDRLKLFNEVTGKFFVESVDKIIYDTNDAYWFLPGLSGLYGKKYESVVISAVIPGMGLRQPPSTVSTVWVYEGGKMVSSPWPITRK